MTYGYRHEGRAGSERPRREPLDYVDTLIGTAELGNTFPAVCLPFGLAKWTPQTVAGEHKGQPPYGYEHRRIQGLRWTNFISGSAVPDYGSMTVMALGGDLRLHPEERASALIHAREIATPYAYAVTLDDYAIRAEVTATERTGFLRPRPTPPGCWLQPNNTPCAAHSSDEAYVRVIPERNEIVGYNPASRYYMRTGEPAGFNGYFVARFSRPFASFGVWKDDELSHRGRDASGQPGAFVRFTTAAGEAVRVRMSKLT